MLTNPILRSKIDILWDRFWSGGISNPLTVIEQISYLVLLKRIEFMENAQVKQIRNRDEKHKLVLGRNDNEYYWSYLSEPFATLISFCNLHVLYCLYFVGLFFNNKYNRMMK